MKSNEKGMNNMNEISGLLAAFAALGIVRAWDAAEEKRISRQEEVFVPFNLSLLSRREQLLCQPETDAAVALSALCAQATV
jgi:hypothetical protein